MESFPEELFMSLALENCTKPDKVGCGMSLTPADKMATRLVHTASVALKKLQGTI